MRTLCYAHRVQKPSPCEALREHTVTPTTPAPTNGAWRSYNQKISIFRNDTMIDVRQGS